jgi:hypothetical protein
MSFKQGEKIRMHDGSIRRVGKDGKLPKMGRKRTGDGISIRGFVRGALVDCISGEEQVGDWHENVITTYGHGAVIRAFVGLQSSQGSTASSAATVLTDLGLARFWAVGHMTEAQSSNFSTKSAIDSSEQGTASTSGSTAGGARATVSAGIQSLAATWTLSQSFQYVSTAISNAVTINAIAQYHNATVGSGTALSIATFASSTKGTTQALNITYNWVFST